MPLPTRPSTLLPHAHSVPSAFRPKLVNDPATRSPVMKKSARRTALSVNPPWNARTFKTCDLSSTSVPPDVIDVSLAVGSTPFTV